MAKKEKKYPSFECSEYDYSNLDNREYSGYVNLKLKFKDGVEVFSTFDVKDFFEYHRRKKTDFFRIVEHIRANARGWGSRYFDILEELQEFDAVDIFDLFEAFIEATNKGLEDQYLNALAAKNESEQLEEEGEPTMQTWEEIQHQQKFQQEWAERDESRVLNDSMPYNVDRKKFIELLEEGTDEMYEALKINFFSEIEPFQRRYPNKWKSFENTLERLFLNFEKELQEQMFPYQDDGEFKEFEIKYYSEKAESSDNEEPPTAR